MLAGKPAFLSPDENTYESFARVWEERKPVYESCATHEVENTGSINDTVGVIKKFL
jgi:shikimate kinase